MPFTPDDKERFTADDRERLIARLESLGEWDWADKLRGLKLPGRPEERVNGITPRQRRLLDLRARMIAAGGNINLFHNDPLIPASHTTWDKKSGFLRRILTLEDRNDLRKALKESQVRKVSLPVSDDSDVS